MTQTEFGTVATPDDGGWAGFASYKRQVNEVTAIRENGAFALATYGCDVLGRRTSMTRGNGTVISYTHDGASRLASLTQDLAGTGYDLGLGFTPTPPARSRASYAATTHMSGSASRSVAKSNYSVKFLVATYTCVK